MTTPLGSLPGLDSSIIVAHAIATSGLVQMENVPYVRSKLQ